MISGVLLLLLYKFQCTQTFKIAFYIIKVIVSQKSSLNCFKIVSKRRQSTQKRSSCLHPEFNLLCNSFKYGNCTSIVQRKTIAERQPRPTDHRLQASCFLYRTQIFIKWALMLKNAKVFHRLNKECCLIWSNSILKVGILIIVRLFGAGCHIRRDLNLT